MAWEKCLAKRGNTGYPTISVNRSGYGYVSASAERLMDHPDYVMLHIDADRQLIGIRNLQSPEPGALCIIKQGHRGRSICLKYALARLGWAITETMTYGVTHDSESGLFVIDLNAGVPRVAKKGGA